MKENLVILQKHCRQQNISSTVKKEDLGQAHLDPCGSDGAANPGNNIQPHEEQENHQEWSLWILLWEFGFDNLITFYDEMADLIGKLRAMPNEVGALVREMRRWNY